MNKKHKCKFEYWGERVGGEFDGKDVYVCKCGDVLFKRVLESEEE